MLYCCHRRLSARCLNEPCLRASVSSVIRPSFFFCAPLFQLCRAMHQPSFLALPQVSCPHSCFNDMLVTGAAPAGFVSMSLAKFGQLVAVGRSGTVWWYHDREFRPLRWKTQRPVEIVGATLGVPVSLRGRRGLGLPRFRQEGFAAPRSRSLFFFWLTHAASLSFLALC
jgi:hypothetical protein